MRTGEAADRTGTYRTGCPCGARAVIVTGTTVPLCPICGRPCSWMLFGTAKPERAHARSTETRRQDPRA